MIAPADFGRGPPLHPHTSSFFRLHREIANHGLQLGMVALQIGHPLINGLRLKGPVRIGEKLITPLLVLGFTNLVRVAEFGDGPSFQSLQDNHRLLFRFPLSSVPGCLLESAATEYSVPTS